MFYGKAQSGGAMGELSIWHWLLVIAIVLILFAPSKFASLGKGIGEGIRNFRTGMKAGSEEKKDGKPEEKKF